MGRLILVGTKWCGHTTQQRISLLEAGIKYNFINDDEGHVSGVKGYPTMICGRPGQQGFGIHAGEMSPAEVQKFCP